MKPRRGHIHFLNCLPLYYGLVKSQAIRDIRLFKATTRKLSADLLSGKIDISPIPSIEYSRHWRELSLLPGGALSISCNGPVKSVLLLSKAHIQELNNRKITLTNTSCTSQFLFKIIIENKYNLRPTVF